MSILALSAAAWIVMATGLLFAAAVVLMFAIKLVGETKRLVEHTRDARGRIRGEVADLSRETALARERIERIKAPRTGEPGPRS